MLLAEKSGIARETAVEVLLNSVMASPMVKYRGPFVLKMPDEAWFDVNMMQKDVLLALGNGSPTRCAAADHGNHQSNAHRRPRHGAGGKGFCDFVRSAREDGGGEDWGSGLMEYWSGGLRDNHHSITPSEN